MKNSNESKRVKEECIAIKPILISFYAGDQYYYEAAKNLKNDCLEANVDFLIEEIIVPEEFNWANICRIKLSFIFSKLTQLNRPVLFVDVDSRLSHLPDFFIDAKFDFGAFLRNFSELDPFKLVQLSRQWVPGVIFINNTEAGRSFASSLNDLSKNANIEATDDYFLQEAWLIHRNRMLTMPFPKFMLKERIDQPEGFIYCGASGNVKEYVNKVQQHVNHNLANIKLKTISEVLKTAGPNIVTKTLVKDSWSNSVNDLSSMLEFASIAFKHDSELAIQIYQKAQYLFPKNYEATHKLTQIYLSKGDLDKAMFFATELTKSEYEDWIQIGRSFIADIELEIRAKKAGLGLLDRIPMWWSKSPAPGNFGDILNPYLIEKFTRNIPRFDLGNKRLIAIGSTIKFASKESTVWGTGSSRKLEHLNPDAKYRAVRGPLTRDVIRSSGGYCDTVYGDPALILPSFYNPKVPKKYKLGYIPHYVHQKEILETDAHVIDVLRSTYDDIESFIREVKSCEAIISTSLHGLIIANAYGIPARWAKFNSSENKISGDDLKYEDYFRSVSMPIQTPFDLSEHRVIDTKSIFKSMDKSVDLKINLEKLSNSFPWELIPTKSQAQN